MMQTEKLKLVEEWDKVFPKSEDVTIRRSHSSIAMALHWQAIFTRRKMPPETCLPSQYAAPLEP